MNRNTNAHFSELPKVELSRSILDRSSSHKLSGNVGDIIPIYVDPDILPGDTISMDTSKIVRFSTLLDPMMDNIQCDVYWFFVPNRLIWDHWQNFMGENTASEWIPQTEYTIPKIVIPDADTSNTNNKVGTILDYMGFPVGMNTEGDVKINALPIRAYCKIMDDWFRSEALTDPLNLYTGDNDVTANTNASYINDVPQGGKPYKAAKYADYFTSCLPDPQKGDAVILPVSVGGDVVQARTLAKSETYLTIDKYTNPFVTVFPSDDSLHRYYHTGSSAPWNGVLGAAQLPTSQWDTAHAENDAIPYNLGIDLPIMQAGFTVNDMRYAFQLQKLLEKDARAGSRYIEVIREHFGVQSSDARLQRSEYLGGNRFAIQVDQVSNTAQTENDFLGDLGAFSVSSDVHSDFTYSAQEHGVLMGLMVCRYDHTYCQGLEQFWSRNSRFDYYWPVFANIGEQPVFKKEIYLTGDPDVDDAPFGFQEAWASYRYKPNRVSAFMRPYVQTGLASWSLTDDYDTTPSLNDSWIREEPSNVDRVLAVSSETAGFQFWADFYFSAKYTRPMPVYSVPGLIDHH